MPSWVRSCPTLVPCRKKASKNSLGQLLVLRLVLLRTEYIGKIGLVHSGERGGALAHYLACAEDLQGIRGIGKPFQGGMIGIHRLIIVGVEHQVHRHPAGDDLVRGHRQDHARVGLVGAHDDGAVDLPEGVAGLQIIQADECASLGAETQDVPVLRPGE